MRRLCVLSASVMVSIALVAGIPASGAAQVSDPISPSNWTTDPSGGHSITSVFLDSVFALPTPFVTPWKDVFRGTRVLPELDLIPGLWTIALGLSAFEAGYLIGSAIDRKWIHVDGTDIGTTFAVGAYTTPVRLGICTTTTSPCFGFLPSGPLWAYQWGASWGTIYYDSTDAAKHAAYVVLHSLTSGTEVCVAQTTGPGGVSECMYQRYITKDQMYNALDFSQPTAYNGQGYSISSGWRQPGACGDTTTACPYDTGATHPVLCYLVNLVTQCGGTPQPPFWLRNLKQDPTFGDPDVNELRCLIDPMHWGCPELDSTEQDYQHHGGPFITIPNCYGQTIVDCESLVNSALAATGSGTGAAFTTTVAPTYDPNIPIGYVVATLAAAGTYATAQSVVVEINSETQGPVCRGNAQWVHYSTQGPLPGMLSKISVTCTSTSDVELEGAIWRCTSRPTAVRAALDAGAFGCLRMITVPPTPVHAVAGRSSPVDPIVMPTGEPQEQGVYYIASAWGAGIAEAYSEVTP